MTEMDNQVLLGKVPGADKVTVAAVRGVTYITAISDSGVTVFSGTSKSAFTAHSVPEIRKGRFCVINGKPFILGNGQSGFSYATVGRDGWSKPNPMSALSGALSSYYLSDNGVDGALLTGNEGRNIRAISEMRGEPDVDATFATSITGESGDPCLTAGAINGEGSKCVAWKDVYSNVWAACAKAGAAKYGAPVKVLGMPAEGKMIALSTEFEGGNVVVHGAYTCPEAGSALINTALFRANAKTKEVLDFTTPDVTDLNILPESLRFYVDNKANAHFVGISSVDQSVIASSSTLNRWTPADRVMPGPAEKIDITGNGKEGLIITALEKAGSNLNVVYKAPSDSNWVAMPPIAIKDRVTAFDTHLDDVGVYRVATIDNLENLSLIERPRS